MNKLQEVGKIIIACETYIVHNDSVLMHQRAKDKKIFPGFWIGPGGHVEEGEDILTAAIREVREETGVTVEPDDIELKVLAIHHHLDRGELWNEYLFRATLHSQSPIVNTKEGISEWIPIHELLQMNDVFPPSKYYFNHIFNNKLGILYNYSQWQNAQLIKVQSERIDKK